MDKKLLYLILAAFVLLDGCGTYVPEIQDFGDSAPGDISHAGQVYVAEIVENIHCSISKAINDLYDTEAAIPGGEGLRDISFLDNWGAQVTLNLTVDEQGVVSPTGNITPIGQPKNWLFNLGLGASISSEAQRIDKVSYIYLISDLRKVHCGEKPGGFMLLQNDLKFKEWLYDTIQLPIQQVVSFPTDLKANVLYYEVKFDVITSGTASPGWKLVNAAINQSGTFLTAKRDRTHDLQITSDQRRQNRSNRGTQIVRRQCHCRTLLQTPRLLGKSVLQWLTLSILNLLFLYSRRFFNSGGHQSRLTYTQQITLHRGAGTLAYN